MTNKKSILLFLVITVTVCCYSQKKDTVLIDASNIKMNYLIPGVNRYLVYFTKGIDGPRTKYQLWTREIKLSTLKDKQVFEIDQSWENNDTIFHTSQAYCDTKSFAPIYQKSWWRNRGETLFDFEKKAGYFNDVILQDNDTSSTKNKMYNNFKMALSQQRFNWNLDLEVFQILPFHENTTFKINFYDPGFSAPSYQLYSVTGSDYLNGYDNHKIECWLLYHGGEGYKETFWISKKTHEILKLEEEYQGSYRYKIKLGFSK